ncbi:hypothetical protein [Streptomyces sp. GC420]|uniref:hypothetical protein n=1 Tax=Streptomyces sp. GC420 TaxID=2697568 RepID=UPI001414F833|nr:hypothetical protein [Streptomyces sp. GC420]NBM16388.1 hypothetical protein [Streptomyces sp. GC420]
MSNAVAAMPVTPEERWSRLDLSQERTGAEHLAQELDAWVEGNIPPFTTAIGMKVRLRYVTWGGRNLTWLRAAGLDVAGPTVDGWKNGTLRPDNSELEKINKAFWLCRRADTASLLKAWLGNRGRGTYMEIWPCEDRDLPMEGLWVRREWQSIVEAWSENDLQKLERIWRKMTKSLGPSPDDYLHVFHVAFWRGPRPRWHSPRSPC